MNTSKKRSEWKIRRCYEAHLSLKPYAVSGNASKEGLLSILESVLTDRPLCVFHSFTIYQFSPKQRGHLSVTTNYVLKKICVFHISLKFLDGAYPRLELTSIVNPTISKNHLAYCDPLRIAWVVIISSRNRLMSTTYDIYLTIEIKYVRTVVFCTFSILEGGYHSEIIGISLPLLSCLQPTNAFEKHINDTCSKYGTIARIFWIFSLSIIISKFRMTVILVLNYEWGQGPVVEVPFVLICHYEQ